MVSAAWHTGRRFLASRRLVTISEILRNAAFYKLFFSSGMRVDEAADWRRVHLKTCRIHNNKPARLKIAF